MASPVPPGLVSLGLEYLLRHLLVLGWQACLVAAYDAHTTVISRIVHGKTHLAVTTQAEPLPNTDTVDARQARRAGCGKDCGSEASRSECSATGFDSCPEKDATGSWIDYEAAVSGDLQLVPEGSFYEALADDYERMVNDGMLLGDEETFQELMRKCEDIQDKANGTRGKESGAHKTR